MVLLDIIIYSWRLPERAEFRVEFKERISLKKKKKVWKTATTAASYEAASLY